MREELQGGNAVAQRMDTNGPTESASEPNGKPLSFDVVDADPDKPFVFAASKVIAVDKVTPDQISSTIPGTGLKSNLAEPSTDDTNVHVHTTGDGKAHAGNGIPPESNQIDSAQEFFTPVDDQGDANVLQVSRSPEQLSRTHNRDFPDTPLGDEEPMLNGKPRPQEGATGQGPGGHEGRLSSGIVEGQEGGGQQRQRTFQDGEPMSLPHNDVVGHFKDERGRTTLPMPGVKAEEPPGPRNEIVLDPRIVHLQYHVDEEDDRDPHGGLVVTPLGEEEVPPLSPERDMLSPPDARRRHTNDKGEVTAAFAQTTYGRSPNDDEGEWEDVGASNRQSPWRTAMGSKATPGSNTPTHRRQKHNKHQVANGAADQTDAAGMSNAMAAGGPKGLGRFQRLNPMRHNNRHANSATTDVSAPTMTNEMLAGTLPVMILKTWLDRDEEGHRAVPVLLGNLRFRIGDSLQVRTGKTGGIKEMFKIECEYGDGAIKWVVYRELRDFVSLHLHYKKSNFGHRVAALGSHQTRHVTIPEFPRNALPGWAKKDLAALDDMGLHSPHSHGRDSDREEATTSDGQQNGRSPGRSPGRMEKSNRQEIGPKSRRALQQYLIDLIRAVMFRPESNRLCIFFELSALTVALGPRGGFQGKAGFLRIPTMQVSRKSNQPGLMPSKWKQHRSPKWFIVRESFFVAVDGPADTDIYDVFLIDTDFTIERPKRAYRKGLKLLKLSDKKSKDLEALDEDGGTDASQHTFYISNAQRRIKLQAKNARQMHQFIVSMERVAMQCIWAGRNRFDSFAPIRVNVAAQWLVDGRDYFWNLSRAINMAKSRIYIHDWWISPEIYLRRPGDERYRLDNLLKRKAEEGVRIFIIIYNEVLAKATPVASQYVKSRLTGLHPNIMMQRSPSHLPNGTFYWSHHEKMCVIDETIAFMGGLDLCFGRWDTSQHVMTDEDHTSPDGPNGPVWRGKDYANERLVEFGDLEHPFDDSIDRTKAPRMPWHDVGLQIVGQPARDLCRHFIQRWNYLLRIKNHTRKMPFLLPPADFTERELVDLGLQGTCEVQICRSVGPWSMGTMSKIEHSVQNAYCKSIQLSEHFVYIENQFFITSTVVDTTPIENKIGDALVSRIIRAHKNGEAWRACVVIPLLPGYTYRVDQSEASSVRLILECQNRTICRGANSIFSRLRKEGINPDDYITFFSLRGWAKFASGALTTEQVYIHGKTMIVDDRLVLCGSANINERSQRGDRDSELVAVVRDTDMIDGTMAGKPFKVGRYAHTLRMRLMREHVGVDVDAIEEDELMLRKPVADADDIALWDPDNEQQNDPTRKSKGQGVTRIKRSTAGSRLRTTVSSAMSSIARGVGENVRSDVHKLGQKIKHPIATAEGEVLPEPSGPGSGPEGDASERLDMGPDGKLHSGFASSVVPTLEEKTLYERRPSASHANGQPLFGMEDSIPEEAEGHYGQTNAQGGQQNVQNGQQSPQGGQQNTQGGASTIKEATVPKEDKEAMNPEYNIRGGPATLKQTAKEALHSHGDLQKIKEATVPKDDEKAVHELQNKTEKFGVPAGGDEQDTEVPRDDDDFFPEEQKAVDARKLLRKHLSAKVSANPWNMPTPTPKIDPNRFHDPLDERFWNDMWVAVAVHNTQIFRKVFRCIPDDLVTTWAQYKTFSNHADKFGKTEEKGSADPSKPTHDQGGSGGGNVGPAGQGKHQPQTHEGKGIDSGVHGKTSPPSNLKTAGHAISGAASHAADKAGDSMSGAGGSGPGGGSGSGAGAGAGSGGGGSGTGAGATGVGGGVGGVSGSGGGGSGGGERKPSGENEAWQPWEIQEMEELLGEVRGHLVVYPTRFLEAEDLANNFLFNQERILPLLIYD